jgi:cytoskeletal protein RodZ
MPLKQKVNNSKINKKLLLLIGAITIFLAFALLEITGASSIFFNRSEKTNDTEAQTTSTAETAQSSFTGGDDRQPNRSQKQEGTATDQSGAIQAIPPENQWSKSNDGVISVYSPTKNQIVQNGQIVSGASTTSTVSFRLIDDVSGVIIQGSLNVVEGRFSGSLNFNTAGTNGRLDIFNSATDGTESSNIEIPVRFK